MNQALYAYMNKRKMKKKKEIKATSSLRTGSKREMI
jgi:hypothetical protein